MPQIRMNSLKRFSGSDQRECSSGSGPVIVVYGCGVFWRAMRHRLLAVCVRMRLRQPHLDNSVSGSLIHHGGKFQNFFLLWVFCWIAEWHFGGVLLS